MNRPYTLSPPTLVGLRTVLNRRDIWFGEDMAGEGKRRSEWNTLLLRDVIAPIYASLVHSAREVTAEGHLRYGIWDLRFSVPGFPKLGLAWGGAQTYWYCHSCVPFFFLLDKIVISVSRFFFGGGTKCVDIRVS